MSGHPFIGPWFESDGNEDNMDRTANQQAAHHAAYRDAKSYLSYIREIAKRMEAAGNETLAEDLRYFTDLLDKAIETIRLGPENNLAP
ncbi:MAG: hypothetical protein R3284_08390 [Rubricoccaceae bacterium]|nr:hypothetical protein [Rubricoccaceae bacterium]